MVVPANSGAQNTARTLLPLSAAKNGAPQDHFQSGDDVLDWLLSCAGHSPTAQSLLKAIHYKNYRVVFETNVSRGYELNLNEKIIKLDDFGLSPNTLGRSTHYRHALLLSFFRAIRGVFQGITAAQNTITHRPDVHFLLERARAADRETIAILCAWELRTAGHPDVWRYALGSDMGDMAACFTDALSKDPSGYYDGSVLTRTFCQWYADQTRVGLCDHRCLEDMDEHLKAHKHEAFGTAPMRGAEVEALSCLPNAPAYLLGMGQNICTDPYFVSMNDAINESHLFQIVYDSKVVMVSGVPFRDQNLAALIFPKQRVNVRD